MPCTVCRRPRRTRGRNFKSPGFDVDEKWVPGRGELREERQRIINERAPPVRITAIFSAGTLARRVGGDGRFTMMDFADSDDPAVMYLESHTGARYLEKPDELAKYREV